MELTEKSKNAVIANIATSLSGMQYCYKAIVLGGIEHMATSMGIKLTEEQSLDIYENIMNVFKILKEEETI